MRLRFVVTAPLPSGRQYVDAYRAASFELTDLGQRAYRRLKEGGPEGRAEFLNLITVALADTHPGFNDLLQAADKFPICVPEYTIERLNNLIGQGSGSDALADDALVRMTKHWPETIQLPTRQQIAPWIRNALDRRFSKDRANKPTQKDILDTVDDAILGFVAKARDIRLDAISFNVCMSWASQLAILEDSRYVEGWPGRTIWATGTVSDHSIHRRGFNDAVPDIVAGLREGFKQIADSVSEARTFGYLPIHRVRAQAAFFGRINLRLVDMVLARIVSGTIQAPYQVQLALGRGTPPPKSEPIFTHEGRRFFDMLITEKGA